MNFIFHIVGNYLGQLKAQSHYLKSIYVMVNMEVLKDNDAIVDLNHVGIINC